MTVTGLEAMLSESAMNSYGWRIPFLIAGVLGAVGLYIRLRLSDTPEFESLRDEGELSTSPLREAITTSWRPILQIIGLVVIHNVGFYIVFTFLPSYFTKTLEFTKIDAFVSITIASLVAIVLIPPLGALSDRIGRKPLLIAGSIGFAVFAYPLFLLLNTGSLPAAIAAHAALAAIESVFVCASLAAASRVVRDPGALQRLLDRLQPVGRGLRRNRAVCRDVAGGPHRQRDRAGVLRDRGRGRHAADGADDAGDGGPSAAEVGDGLDDLAQLCDDARSREEGYSGS